MQMKRFVAQAAVIAVLAAGIGAAGAAPARAGESCRVVTGSTQNNTQIWLCADPWFSGTTVGLRSGVQFGRNATTTATGCKITGWLILSKPGNKNKWEGPRTTNSCNYPLQHKGDPIWWSNHWSGYTSGTNAYGRVCIDLYYNGSNTSGWQRCYNSPWVR